MEDFYRYGTTKTPIAHRVFHENSWDWLESLQQESEATAGDAASVTVRVQGISCAGCVWLIEAIFREHPGAISCLADSANGTLELRWNPDRMDLTAFAADLQRFGYLLGPLTDSPRSALRPLVRKLGLCAALAMNAMLFALPRYLGMDPGDRLAALFDTIGILIATLSIAIGGTYFFKRAVAAICRGELHIDLPISLGLLFAYSGSLVAWKTGNHTFAYFDFVAIFTFLMLLGRWLQERSVEANRRHLLDGRVGPGKIRLLRNGRESEVPSEQLELGDRFSVVRNALVPVRARLADASATFALNWINGEPAPRTYSAGSIVPSGARNLSPQAVGLTALEPWNTSMLASLLALGSARPWRNVGLQRVIRFYLSAVLVLAIGGFFLWGFAGGDWTAAFQVLISVLVVSCPCAIGVALPLLDDRVAMRLQAFGIYLREHSLWSRLRRVRAILLDKTGTLTLETLSLSNPSSLESLKPETRQTLLALVGASLHPVAACLREHLLAQGTEFPQEPPTEVREITGFGLEWISPLGTWRLGRASWATPGDLSLSGTQFSLDGISLAGFQFQEELRPGAGAQVDSLCRMGMEVFLLSGDNSSRVAAMARALGLPKSSGMGGLTPQEKAGWVRTHWPHNALFLGDGANDSMAFDAALCRGTPANDTGLLEQKSDFFLLGRSLEGLGELFSASKIHHRTALLVFMFSIAYNLFAVSLALAGFMNPLVAAILMPLSSLASIGIVFLATPPAISPPPQPALQTKQ